MKLPTRLYNMLCMLSSVPLSCTSVNRCFGKIIRAACMHAAMQAVRVNAAPQFLDIFERPRKAEYIVDCGVGVASMVHLNTYYEAETKLPAACSDNPIQMRSCGCVANCQRRPRGNNTTLLLPTAHSPCVSRRICIATAVTTRSGFTLEWAC